MACPGDCAACCYEIRVYIYYLTGECPVKFPCNNYNGAWILTQEGAAGTDCSWLYTDVAENFTITITCDGDFWLLTITHDGNICAQWSRILADNLDCPPVSGSWLWVQGDCTGNAWAYTECSDWDRPVYPPAWYPVGLRTGVYRMRVKWT